MHCLDVAYKNLALEGDHFTDFSKQINTKLLANALFCGHKSSSGRVTAKQEVMMFLFACEPHCSNVRKSPTRM